MASVLCMLRRMSLCIPFRSPQNFIFFLLIDWKSLEQPLLLSIDFQLFQGTEGLYGHYEALMRGSFNDL